MSSHCGRLVVAKERTRTFTSASREVHEHLVLDERLLLLASRSLPACALETLEKRPAQLEADHLS